MKKSTIKKIIGVPVLLSIPLAYWYLGIGIGQAYFICVAAITVYLDSKGV